MTMLFLVLPSIMMPKPDALLSIASQESQHPVTRLLLRCFLFVLGILLCIQTGKPFSLPPIDAAVTTTQGQTFAMHQTSQLSLDLLVMPITKAVPRAQQPAARQQSVWPSAEGQRAALERPANGQNLRPQTSRTRPLDISTFPQTYVYKGYKWPGTSPVVKFKVNINSSQAGGANGSIADFRNAIIAAANTWSMDPQADFILQYDGETAVTAVGQKNPGANGVNEIVFMHQGITNTAGLGLYFFLKDSKEIVETDIWLNDDYRWDATGTPDDTELDLQSGVLHEMGHWLTLGHDDNPAAVMFPTLNTGVLKRELSADDLAGLEFIYPCSAAPCNPVGPKMTPTATPTATLLPTATPEATVTPTPIVNQFTVYLPAVTK